MEDYIDPDLAPAFFLRFPPPSLPPPRRNAPDHVVLPPEYYHPNIAAILRQVARAEDVSKIYNNEETANYSIRSPSIFFVIRLWSCAM